MREKIRHYLNPLHIYCRLINLGIKKKKAQTICKYYQKIYSILF